MKKIMKNFKKVEVMEALLGAVSLAIVFGAMGAKALPVEGSSFELSCRMKAKEVAAETYRGCVTEGKKAQLDQIKADYQSRIRALKEEYSEELKKLSNGAESQGDEGGGGGNNSTSNAPTSKKKLSSKSKNSGKMIARTLPPKKVATVSSDDLPSSDSNELSYSLHPTARTESRNDENSMDIPEPIPVDNN